MATWLTIVVNSLKITLQELKVNKLRTALSLTGVAFGIFCIIGVLATVNSLEINIQHEVSSLGSNTIYIDKWDYSGGPDKPFWKFRARPAMKYEELALIKQRTHLVQDIAFLMSGVGNLIHDKDEVENATIYGITQAQTAIQPINFEEGRYFSQTEFTSGSAVAIIGFENAANLFGSSERAIGNSIEFKGKKLTVIGVIRKEGKNFIGWDYDNCMMLPHQLCKQLMKESESNPVMIVKAKDNITTAALNDELEGVMRQIRRLSPLQEDNFSLNSVEAFSKAITGLFAVVDIVGTLIGIISLIVGMFGIANIMFVTVKERTGIIGLKKAIGAKKSSILMEFLIEATILCLFGGAIGLLLVYILALILSGPFHFPVFISMSLLFATVGICVVVGVLSGFFPARKAARLDPVVAIRSK